MKITIQFPWHQYAVITYVAKSLKGSSTLGKTAMQKIVYLLEELGTVPLDYKFELYNYGPYSSDLAGDLDFVANLGGIGVDYDGLSNMYRISPGGKTDQLIDKAQDFFDQHSKNIDRVLKQFGSKRARDLELRATMIYILRYLNREKNGSSAEFVGRRPC